MPETAQPGKSKAAPAKAQKPATPKHGPKRFDPLEHGGVQKRGWLFLFCGVILPTLAMVFEINFHFCARHFFDPFPSPAHVVLFALIPLSNFLVWLGTRRDLSNHYAFMSLVNGMAMGIACLYTLMFLPLTPMACLFSLVLGFGLLGLAPLLSLPCNWIAGKTVCHLASRKITYFNAHQVEHLGHMIILVMVIAVELPSTLTRINLSRAADRDVAVSSDGVAWLRKFGSQEVLLRACYERSGRATDILGSLYESAHPLNVDEARRIFYQVTGKPFNSVPIPRSARATIQHTGVVTDPNSPNAGVEDEFDLDTDIAGEAVSGVARGLSVKQSHLDTTIDADGALASVDWSFDFVNDSKFDREARAKILLPPRAVVTRATLTVNNIEKEATIMVRSAARARYRRAVVEHKDPLLVSTCGPDQLLVQCFPVRPGQSMKVKLEIAAPLNIDERDKGVLVLPAFLERNFQVDSPNDVCAQATKPFTVGGLRGTGLLNRDAGGILHMSGQLDAVQMASLSGIIAVERDKNLNLVWCKTGELPGAEIVRQVAQPHYDGIKNLIVVIDGSASMQRFMPQIAAGLKALPPSVSAEIKMVGDTISSLTPAYTALPPGAYNAALDQVKGFKTAGGEDDSVAIAEATTRAYNSPDTSVLWIHAAQPITSSQKFIIEDNMRGAGSRPLLFDMQLVAGPNELLRGSNSLASLVRVARASSASEDLAALLRALDRPATAASPVDFKAVSDGPAPDLASVPAHLNAATPVTAGPNLPAAAPTVAPAVIASRQYVPDVILGGEFRRIRNAGTQAIHQGREVDSRLAKIWGNQQICLDSESGFEPPRREAIALANDLQIVSPVSSAIVTEPEPVDKPEASLLARQADAAAKKNDFVLQLHQIRRSLASSKNEITEKLSSLSIASLSQESKMAAAPEPSLKNLNNYSATAGGVASKERDLAKDSIGTTAGAGKQKAADMGQNSDAFGSLGASTEQITSQGQIESLNKTLTNAANAPASPPAREELEKSQVGNDETATPEAKIVPEADTWMLLVVVAAALALAVLTKRRSSRKG